ncbi:related to TOB3 (member of AAA-ATPase family) [Fusarium torulosum]|uniref:Related to TOB3 (Member of AAA-ATPase family) n=1 Tax=Fusarium torulosum TaxID=33205 RepID=A0AAE8SGQ4_9HYPO|nr:related to TOB3 (member of AAA-ATPase family) [Fusarium torulosum]
MDIPQPHEVQIFDDDTSSIASFEDIPPRHRPRTRNLSRRIISPPPKREILKVDGKVPDVIHVVKYLGWRDNVVEFRQSTQPFESISPYGSHGGLDLADGEDSTDEEKPVLEIVTRVLPRSTPHRPLHPPPPGSPRDHDRPITGAFEQVDHCFDSGLPVLDSEPQATGPEVTRPFMIIHSEHLINALKAVMVYYPYVNFDGKSVKITAPYRVLYHHREELAYYKHRQPSTHSPEYTSTTAKHIDVLLKFLDENLGDDIRRESERHQLATPKATFDLFWLLLKPGEVIYAKRHDIWTPYIISSVSIDQGNSDPYDAYRVHCWMLESNGTKVNRFMSSFHLPQWLGEQAIGSLSVIPAMFWPEDLEAQGGMTMREKNIALGKLYWELLKRPTYMDYEGHLVNSGARNRHCRGPTGFMSGRVICDAPGFDNFYNQGPDGFRGDRYNRRPRYSEGAPPVKDHLPRDLPCCGCDACMEDHSGRNTKSPYRGFEDLDPTRDSPPDNEIFYLLCSKTMPGFVLGDRRWGHLSIANLKPVESDKEAFKYLVLDDEIKMTVKALIGKFATNLGEGKVSPWGNDFVKNKGEGRIFLLHGAPGVGKTCTAECVAELTNRPLISLTSGDLSVDSDTVESNLSYFLELGQRYGALVLLDEADIYLERRRSKDIMRNGLVSVFLRALEYYRGVLFLTTNRVQSFDSAFLSRIHVALHYKSLSHEDRERIWTYSFDRLSDDSNGRIQISGAAREFVWNSQDVRSLKWNGREIRNAMQTALALAENEAEEEHTERITISEKHLRAVMKMSRGFRDYIKNAVPVQGFEDTLEDSDSDIE